MKNVKGFIIEYLQREYTFPTGTDVMSINYRAEGYIDSMGMIMFIASIEDEFGIEFSDEDMERPELNTIGGLISVVEAKVAAL